MPFFRKAFCQAQKVEFAVDGQTTCILGILDKGKKLKKYYKYKLNML